MEEKILDELKKIEREKEVKIVYACESGSRAWGFPSLDSDYDVRFIYVHPRKWYLSLFEKRDVIERPLSDVLDISGWDLRKSLRLLGKSNAPIHEWLSSPIRYQMLPEAAQLMDFAPKCFLPKTSFYHYLSMAKNSVKAMAGDKVKIKSYLYALRCVLCCQWIMKQMTAPPVPFALILEDILPGGEVRKEIDSLVHKRSKAGESDLIDRSPLLDNYLSARITALKDSSPNNPSKPNKEDLDKLFREVLNSFRSFNNGTCN